MTTAAMIEPQLPIRGAIGAQRLQIGVVVRFSSS